MDSHLTAELIQRLQTFSNLAAGFLLCLIPSTLHFTLIEYSSSPATQSDFLLRLQCPRHCPTSAPLHLLYIRPALLFSRLVTSQMSPSLRAFPTLIQRSPASHSWSCHPVCHVFHRTYHHLTLPCWFVYKFTLRHTPMRGLARLTFLATGTY